MSNFTHQIQTYDWVNRENEAIKYIAEDPSVRQLMLASPQEDLQTSWWVYCHIKEGSSFFFYFLLNRSEESAVTSHSNDILLSSDCHWNFPLIFKSQQKCQPLIRLNFGVSPGWTRIKLHVQYGRICSASPRPKKILWKIHLPPKKSLGTRSLAFCIANVLKEQGPEEGDRGSEKE